MDVRRTRELEALGLSRAVLARQARRGTLTRIRHGAYSELVDSDEIARHRQLVAGTWPVVGDQAVLSDASAAVLHGLPVWSSMLGRVRVARPTAGHGKRSPHLHVQVAALDSSEIVEIEGYRVTSLERTAVDHARGCGFERAVAVLDAALHRGADPALLQEVLQRSTRRHGVAIVREALAFADGRSESVGESISRVRIAAAGLPAPTLQVEVRTASGMWVARSDFGWLEHGVLGEFDGRVKYRGSGDEVADVVMREKRREDAIRAAGWVVVRWYWSELDDPRELRRRILAAFEEAAALRQRRSA
jgi:predicted transcriptional regulator of viral defense system